MSKGLALHELGGTQDQPRRLMESDSLVITLPDAARLLGISKGTAYTIAGQPGGIPVLRLGKRMVVPKAALLKMLEDAGKLAAP